MRFAHIRQLGAVLALIAFGSVLSGSQAYAAKDPGGRIIYGTRNGLFSANPDGSGKKKLFSTDGVLPEGIRVSPDGSKVSYLLYVASVDHWKLQVTNLSTGTTRTVVPPPVYLSNATEAGAWSHDSSQIVVDRSSRGTWLVDANGQNLREILARPTGQFTWNKSDTKIAFIDERNWVSYYDLRRDRVRRIAKGWVPKWSPARNLLALSKSSSGSPVKVYNLKGEQVLRSKVLGVARYEWTPSGSGLLVADSEDPNSHRSELYYLPTDGSEKQQIMELDPGTIGPPVLSPNGKHAAFSTCIHTSQFCRNRSEQSLFTSGPDGQNPTERLSIRGTRYLLSWSPNSRALLLCKKKGPRYFFNEELTPVRGVSTCDVAWARKG